MPIPTTLTVNVMLTGDEAKWLQAHLYATGGSAEIASTTRIALNDAINAAEDEALSTIALALAMVEPSPFVVPSAEPEGCAECAYIKSRGGFGPPHNASPRCESGRRNHCSCDTCF